MNKHIYLPKGIKIMILHYDKSNSIDNREEFIPKVGTVGVICELEELKDKEEKYIGNIEIAWLQDYIIYVEEEDKYYGIGGKDYTIKVLNEN